MNKDRHKNFSISHKNTFIIDRTSKTTQHDATPTVRQPKKTRLERIPLSGTTSAILQAIQGAHIKHLAEYFEQTCDRRPHERAIISNSFQITYEELDQCANRLAHLLLALDIGSGNTVGILLHPSLDTYIALLAILKAGAAFVPLDPSFPANLITLIARDADLHTIITTSSVQEKTSGLPCPVLELDALHAALSAQPQSRPQIQIDPSSLCYINYKLDASDTPKGVAVTHTNIVNFLRVVTPTYGMTRHDRVYQGMPLAFDFALEEIWPAWIVGATLVAGFPTPLAYELGNFLAEYNITMFCCIPSQLVALQSDISSLRLLVICGQVCPEELVARWARPSLRMLYTYGPTEATIPQANATLLNETIPTSLVDTQTVTALVAETSRLRILKELDLGHIYNHVLTDPLYRNSLFNMASTFMLGGLGFVFWIIIARLYKAESVGIATTLISIMTLLTSFTLLGLNSSLNRYLPKSVNKNELINSSFILVTLFTLLVSVIFLSSLGVFSPQLVFLQSSFFYSVSFAAFVIFCAWNSLVESVSMAFRSASNIFMKNSIISILKLLFPFAFIAFGAYGIFASTATALTLGTLAGLAVLMLKFKIRPSLSVNLSLVRETSLYSFANYIVGFMFNMPSLVLPVIILNVLSAKYAAYYYIASMIQNILLIIPLATAQALLTEGAYNEADLKKHVKKALVTILITLVPATAIIIFGGNVLLQFFGKSYASEAFSFLQLYSISTIFTALLLVANAILNVRHQTKWLILSNTFASVLTLWLSYAFVSGKLVGIGWGWLLGQAIAGIISLILIVKVLFT